MPTHWITPEDDAHWLKIREGFVSSTESAALFDIPDDIRPGYIPTAFELWHIKHRRMDSGFKENSRTRRGKRLEWPIAQEVAEIMGWEVEPLKSYAYRTDVRMGASFDAKAICPERGPGLLEIKLVDWRVLSRHWEADEAPPHIEIQVQHQLHVADCFEWAAIAAWSGTEPKILIIPRDREMGEGIARLCNDFWSWNQPPEPDYSRDTEALKRVYPKDNGAELDAYDDKELLGWAEALDDAKAQLAVLDDVKKRLENQIRVRLGDHAAATLADGWLVKAKAQADAPPRFLTVTEDMVGDQIQVFSGRKGGRPVSVKRLKDNESRA